MVAYVTASRTTRYGIWNRTERTADLRDWYMVQTTTVSSTAITTMLKKTDSARKKTKNQATFRNRPIMKSQTASRASLFFWAEFQMEYRQNASRSEIAMIP